MIQNVTITVNVSINIGIDVCFKSVDMFGNSMNDICTKDGGKHISIQNVSQSQYTVVDSQSIQMQQCLFALKTMLHVICDISIIDC